jgi:exonuclease SbcC|tara:strand:- start:58 stop:2115 length:2058 start_codon:yes stop_codon:yes gene_type:complete
MKLKKLRLQNIRSYDEEEIVFPEGSTLLSGDIGSGKTSILLAIEYALFGLQPGQKGSALLANGKSFGGVILEFEVDGKNIILERKLKRTSKSISQDSAAITIDGERTEASVTEIKTKVLELLNYPSEFIKKTNLLYRYTVYTPQEEMKQIILENPETRLNTLRNIFGIDKYKRIKENLSFLTLKLREKSRILQVEIKDLDERKNKLDSSNKFIEIVREKIISKNKDLIKFLEERKKIEEEIKGIEDKVKEKENFEKEIEKSQILLSSKTTYLSSEEENLQKLIFKVSEAKELFDENKFNKIVSEIELKKIGIEELNKNYIQLSGLMSSLNLKKQEDLEKKNRIFKIDICPTCLQDVSENHKHNILNDTGTQIKKSETEIEKLKSQLSKIGSSLETEKKTLLEFQEIKTQLQILRIKTAEIQEAKLKINELTNSINSSKKDEEILKKHMDNLKNSILEFSKFSNFYEIKQVELKQAFQKEKQIEIELAEFRKEEELTKKEIGELKTKIEEIEKVKSNLIKTIELEQWLSGEFLNLINFTERNIMLTLRNEFSKLFNKWFGMLTTDSFYVNLDETFSPIISQGDFELDYAFLSGGERTAVALAYRLALNQILNSLLSKIKTQNLVILDEPTDGFSEQQLDKVRDILQELNVEQLILVSHEQKIEGFVDNVIKLKKEIGLSKLEDRNL